MVHPADGTGGLEDSGDEAEQKEQRFLARMQTLQDQMLATVPHCRHIGLEILETWQKPAGGGVGVMALPWRPELVGDPETGHMHGGALITLADSSGALAVYATLPPGSPIATLDLRLDYLKPARKGVNLVCHAECYKSTRKVSFMRAEIREMDGESDDPVAVATGTYITTQHGFAANDLAAGEGALPIGGEGDEEGARA